MINSDIFYGFEIFLRTHTYFSDIIVNCIVNIECTKANCNIISIAQWFRLSVLSLVTTATLEMFQPSGVVDTKKYFENDDRNELSSYKGIYKPANCSRPFQIKN